MCMKNISTDILFFDEINNSKSDNNLINIYGITKSIPEVEVNESENDNDLLLIPRISLMLSINATDKGGNKENNTIDFNKTYRICIRITETSSGKCVDTVHLDIHPCEEEVSLCRKIYNKRMFYRLENIILTKPPVGKDLCVFKVLIQEIKEGNVLEENWIAQSMHPVKILYNK